MTVDSGAAYQVVMVSDLSPAATQYTASSQAEAYALQTAAFGSLKPGLRRQIEGETQSPGKRRAARMSKNVSHLTPGTRLVREWNGRTHHVDVIAGGFVWNGTRHRSLSAIAREITGVRWSGPRFFSL